MAVAPGGRRRRRTTRRPGKGEHHDIRGPNMNREKSRSNERRVVGRPRLVRVALVLGAAAVASACTPHHEALTHPCPTIAGRGAIALAKVGLAPQELKAQEQC
jgi:hypothetical protein